MFEITHDHIALLGDGQLRELVALLCEAEVRRAGFSATCVSWGGNQDAKDGGIDVRVTLPEGAVVSGFVPRASVGFQTKTSDMPRRAIIEEMCPNNALRDSIRGLAAQSGAYILVSSSASTSDSALSDRRDAMAVAVSNVDNASLLYLDFFDSSRVATWTRDHPGLIPWVRRAIGREIVGWQSYAAWTNAPEGVDGEYLLDDTLKVRTESKHPGGNVSAAEGLDMVRDVLREPRGIVRLVGLSGVGKTRFVQALFDGRVGKRSLDPALAAYTNMSDDPNPQPTGFASDLVASRTRAIIVVDNCAPELHRRLTEVTQGAESLLSVITVEYDVRDDEPEGTEVFSLEPSSGALIQKLLERRFPDLSQVDAQTAAEFSGGNARMAIAFAATVGKHETLAGLKEQELFRRLFHQRHEPNENLLRAAQACALFYSFEGEDTSENGELARLGELAGQTALEVFRHVAELKRRDLVQQRGHWRAVLPHGIANRLAEMALQDIPYATIMSQIEDSDRLLKSFSRRLGYLHDCPEAVAIAEEWMAQDGLLGKHAALNGLGQTLFENIVPTAPQAALSYLERVLSEPLEPTAKTHWQYAARRIRSLAYDSKFFARCVELLARLSDLDASGHSTADPRATLISLFYLYLSGTQASVEQRLDVIETLTSTIEPVRQSLAIGALDAMLEAWHFSSSYEFEFGAHSRDHGYSPRTDEEVARWFSKTLGLVEKLARAEATLAPQVRATLASRFRGLWTMAHMFDDLDRISRTIGAQGFWREGWVTVRQTLQFDGGGFPTDVRARLAELEGFLRPKNLVEKTRSVALVDHVGLYDLDDDALDLADEGGNGPEVIAERLGRDVANHAEALQTLLPELVVGAGLQYYFGRGLAEDTYDVRSLWDRLTACFAEAPPKNANPQVFRGILGKLQDQHGAVAAALLDEAVESGPLAAWLPVLQSAVNVDARGIARLKRSVLLKKVPIGCFHNLALGGWSSTVDAADLASLLELIAEQPDGFRPALDVLYMRFHGDRQEKREHTAELLRVGRTILGKISFDVNNHRQDHEIGAIVAACLPGDDGRDLARDLCSKFRGAVERHEVYAWNHGNLLRGIFTAQPAIAMDTFLGSDSAGSVSSRVIGHSDRHFVNPLEYVSEQEILNWCDVDPAVRYVQMATCLPYAATTADQHPIVWKQIALTLIERAPDPPAVLNEFIQRFRPMSWSGSLASILERSAKLLDDLADHADPDIVSLAKEARDKLFSQAEAARQWELKEDRSRDERFE
jgi:hypothetical protein